MSNHGRSTNNQVKLQLKEYHRRITPVRIVMSTLDCSVKPLPINKGSGSGGRYKSRGSFTYVLEEIVVSVRCKGELHKINIIQTFNKAQLLGKILIVSGKHYKIIKQTKYKNYVQNDMAR